MHQKNQFFCWVCGEKVPKKIQFQLIQLQNAINAFGNSNEPTKPVENSEKVTKQYPQSHRRDSQKAIQ